MKFHILDHTGHSTLEFTEEQKAQAEKTFNDLVEKGYTPASRVDGERDYHVSRRFAVADETVFVPQLKGG